MAPFLAAAAAWAVLVLALVLCVKRKAADNVAEEIESGNGTTEKTFAGHTERVSSVAFHPTNPNICATGSHDTTAKIWNVETGECTKTLEGHTGELRSVAFHPTNPLILATGYTGLLALAPGSGTSRLESAP